MGLFAMRIAQRPRIGRLAILRHFDLGIRFGALDASVFTEDCFETETCRRADARRLTQRPRSNSSGLFQLCNSRIYGRSKPCRGSTVFPRQYTEMMTQIFNDRVKR